MADHPSDEWGDEYPRTLKSRNKEGREAAEARGGHKTVTGTDRYKTPEPVGHRLTSDPNAKKEKEKAKQVSGKSAENKAVSGRGDLEKTHEVVGDK